MVLSESYQIICMNIRPTKRKILISLAIAIAYCVLIFFYERMTLVSYPCSYPPTECVDYTFIFPIQGTCNCTSLGTALNNYTWNLVFPFIVIYLILSFLEKKKTV